MRKPNKLYRKLGGKRSAAGVAFAVARHPVRSLRSVFGWDVSAKDIAEGFNVAPSKHAYQMVMATLQSWSRTYRGPKLSWMFKMLSTSQPKKMTAAPKPEMD